MKYFKFRINSREWHVVFCKKDDNRIKAITEDEVSGLTDYFNLTVYICIDAPRDLINDTIYHELAHAYIFTYGMGQNENFSEENVCDMFGAFGEDLFNNAYNLIKYSEKSVDKVE